MFPPVSFVTANFVARPLAYRMTGGWQEGDQATNAWFSPLATFEDRFGAMLGEIADLGFTAIDLWGAHLSWRWATSEHVAIARRLLEQHNLSVRSYATWVKGGAADLRAACHLCASLGIPMIAGWTELLTTDRSDAVRILREQGIRCAVENHAEHSTKELLDRLGAGDEDVVGVALDTGWCGTQGWDILTALDQLGPRLMAVHLKDVKARRHERTGYELVDMGHETCRIGDGILPMEAFTRELRARGFRGPLGIEHEPETFDPRDDARASREIVEGWWEAAGETPPENPLRVAIVGCGNIADAYGHALRDRQEVKIVGATDIDRARAERWTTEFGGTAYPSLDTLLEDPEVEAVVNLTTHEAHAEVVGRALAAGKHVHTEKPLAMTHAEAERLVALADARGLRLSCSPSTWLGEAQQTAWKLIREGAIGTPRVAYATVDWGRIEGWHPNPEPFYRVGPVFDVGVYPLALLTAWFGPVTKVVAGGGVVLPDRTRLDGQPFHVQTADWLVAVLDFRAGVRARLTSDFYVGDPAPNRSGLEVHGDLGSISTSWFSATAPVMVGPFGGQYRRIAPVREPASVRPSWCDWAASVVGLWQGLRDGRPHSTAGAHAAHVVQVMEAMHRSASQGVAVNLEAAFPSPEPQPWAS